jgi:hypothetical protein
MEDPNDQIIGDRADDSFARRLQQASPHETDEASMGTAGPSTAHPPAMLMSLEAIWDARDRAFVLLQREHIDAAALESIKGTICLLMGDLERSTRRYSEAHGMNTPEGQKALISLDAAREDLGWVTAQRQSATSVEIRNKLHHALRSSVNALALLRWSVI